MEGHIQNKVAWKVTFKIRLYGRSHSK